MTLIDGEGETGSEKKVGFLYKKKDDLRERICDIF